MAFRNLNNNETVTVDVTVRMSIPIKVNGVLQTDKIVWQAHRRGTEVAIFGIDLSKTWHMENGAPVPDCVFPQWFTGLPQAAIQFDV